MKYKKNKNYWCTVCPPRYHVYSIFAAFSAQQGTGESVEAMWRPVW